MIRIQTGLPNDAGLRSVHNAFSRTNFDAGHLNAFLRKNLNSLLQRQTENARQTERISFSLAARMLFSAQVAIWCAA